MACPACLRLSPLEIPVDPLLPVVVMGGRSPSPNAPRFIVRTNTQVIALGEPRICSLCGSIYCPRTVSPRASEPEQGVG